MHMLLVVLESTRSILMTDQILPADCPRLLTTAQIAKILNKHISTIWRWINKGVLVHGIPVRLRAIRLGGQSVVTISALQQFLAALNERNTEATGSLDFDSTSRACEAHGL